MDPKNPTPSNQRKLVSLPDAELILATLAAMPYGQVHKAVAALMNSPTAEVTVQQPEPAPVGPGASKR